MDYENLKLGLLLLNMLVTAGVWLFVRRESSNRAEQRAIKELQNEINKKLALKCKRINELEIQVSALPTNGEIVRIHQRLDEAGKDLRTMVLMMGEIAGQIKQMNKGPI